MRSLFTMAVFIIFVIGLSASDRPGTPDEILKSNSENITPVLTEPYGPLKNIYFSPPDEQWLIGYNMGLDYFYGGGCYGIDFGTSWGGSKLDPVTQPDSFPNVEIRFSTTATQKAYRYQRGGDNNWGYESYNEVPFTVWDTDHNRQLNIAFVEWVESSVFDATWNPNDDEAEYGGREYLFIFASDYSGEDPMNSTICYPCNSILWNNGDLDILYVVWPILISGHTISELADGQKLVFSKTSVRPECQFLSPSRNEPSANLTNGLRVGFDRELDAATLTGNSFFVSGNIHGRIPGSVSFLTQSNEAVFMPMINASAGERITATITTDVKSTEGYEINHDYYWSFFNRTEDTPGEFGESVVYDAGDAPTRVCAAFINNDDNVDIVVLNANSNNFYIYYGNGDGTFAAPLTYSAFQYPTDMCTADLNCDGYMDVAVTDTSGDNICLYTNNGTGALSISSSINMSGQPIVIETGDLDGDGDVDLAIAVWESSESKVYILLNDGAGQFAPHWYAESYDVPHSPRDIKIADIDNDNNPDIIATGLGSVGILEGWGDGTFSPSVDAIAPELSCRGVAIADLDDDGFNDIAVNHLWDGVIRVHKGSGAFQGFTQTYSYSFGEPTPELMIGDINGDGKLDLAATVMIPGLGILDNQTGCVFSKDSIYTAGEACMESVLADLDNDNDLDVVVLRSNNDDIAVLLNYLTTDVDDEHESQPNRFALVQNYPNPFNPVTTIQYSLAKRSRVTIDIFNIQGQKLKTLIDRNQSAGSYSITWDGIDASGNPAASGIYLYRIQADDYTETKKMVLLK